MKRSISAVLAVILGITVLVPAARPEVAAAAGTYRPTGTYLYIASSPRISERDDVRMVDGVPQVKVNGQWVTNVTTVAQYGLQEYSLFVSGQTQSVTKARIAADWLVNNQSSSGAWLYRYRWELASLDTTLEPPWSSAMAQGQAMSLLMRVHHATGKVRFLDSARLAIRPLQETIAQGGLVGNFFGRPIYEEYPTQPHSHVLNGFLFTLFGLYDLAEIGGSSAARRLFTEGVETVKFALPFYDQRTVTAYHAGHLTTAPRPVKVASARYHEVHVKQLTFLATIVDSSLIRYYRDAWGAYRVPAFRPGSTIGPGTPESESDDPPGMMLLGD